MKVKGDSKLAAVQQSITEQELRGEMNLITIRYISTEGSFILLAEHLGIN